MRVTADTDLTRYAEAVLPWLRNDPVRNNVLATVLQSRLDGMTAIENELLLLRLVDENAPDEQSESLVGVALRTPPQALLLSKMPLAAVGALATYLVSTHPMVHRYNGPVEEVRALVDQIATSTGGRPTQIDGHGMFQAVQASLPFAVPGNARAATTADRDLLVAWSAAFQQAVPHAPHTETTALIDARLARPELMWVWEEGGEPISMSALTPPSAGVRRINLVYTPPGRRGNGYASALVAALTSRVLAAGDTPMLFTDLANPTSNKIYQAIGYERIGTNELWEASPPG
jgi:predicted GNAT family acetyltransferase